MDYIIFLQMLFTVKEKKAKMGFSSEFFSFLLLVVVTYASLLSCGKGVVNIDCGKPKGWNRYDEQKGVNYTSDEDYINFDDVGKIYKINSPIDGDSDDPLNDLRSFPNSRRSCFELEPLNIGKNYLFRAFFLYGDYDGLHHPPKFDIYLGVDLWETIEISDVSVTFSSEIIAAATGYTVSFCLVDKGFGTPFVSAIDFRPVVGSYGVSRTRSAVSLKRLDFGATDYSNKRPYYRSTGDDQSDRLWTAYNNQPGWTTVSTSTHFNSSGEYDLPFSVMSTAVVPAANHINFNIGVPRLRLRCFLLLHFADIQIHADNHTRTVDIYVDNEKKSTTGISNFRSSTSCNLITSTYKEINIRIDSNSGSLLPPIINALELYMLRELTETRTYNKDANAIIQIKKSYNVIKNWMGDPCCPKEFVWNGLNCTYESSESRIISLNLSSSDLKGEIPLSIANLSQLQYLDLSNNRLTGGIPEFLGNLEYLQYLNLKGNRLNLSVPKNLADKVAGGTLFLSINDQISTKKKSKLALILTYTSISVVLLVSLFIIAWRFKIYCFAFKQKCEDNNQAHTSTTGNSLNLLPSFNLANKKFTYPELVQITDNFKKILGRGAFGRVFYGEINNGVPVAVKMLSELSPEGRQQFQSEALLLTRIHHKNLVSLVGYCSEIDCVALVYEYLAEGTIADHLRDGADRRKDLVWEERLRISVEAAQGLQYLHDGCTPGVVHRDVKTSNILLSRDLEVKIGDFELSRNFQSDRSPQFHTDVVGTPGYLDPEYLRNFRLNEKSDVYSFGVVLLELISGQPAISRDNAVTLVQWVKPKIDTGDLTSVIDPQLDHYNTNSVWKVIEIAMACTTPSSVERPSMLEVLIALKDCLVLENYDIGFNQQLTASEESVKLSTGGEDASDEIVLRPLAR